MVELAALAIRLALQCWRTYLAAFKVLVLVTIRLVVQCCSPYSVQCNAFQDLAANCLGWPCNVYLATLQRSNSLAVL
jgi:hypothetical protein